METLQEHKQVIKDLIETYIFDLDQNGVPKKSITEIVKLIDRAVKLIGDDHLPGISDAEIEKFAFDKYHDVEDSRWFEPLQVGAKWSRDKLMNKNEP